MKSVYILIVIIMAVLVIGCVGKKAEPETKIQTPPVVPAATSPAETPAEDLFGTDNDLNAMDNLTNDLNMDMILSDAI